MGDFVCQQEDSKKTKTKNKIKEESSKPINRLNIGNLKAQFEEGEVFIKSTSIKSAPANVQKLDPIKMFSMKEEDLRPKNKRDYAPVIIDKAAFERTVGLFETETELKNK